MLHEHAELIARGGHYASLHDKQSKESKLDDEFGGADA